MAIMRAQSIGGIRPYADDDAKDESTETQGDTSGTETKSDTKTDTKTDTIVETTDPSKLDKTQKYKVNTEIKKVKYDSSGIYSGVIPDKYAAVNTDYITLGSIIDIEGTKYTATTGITDASVTAKVVLTTNSLTEVLESASSDTSESTESSDTAKTSLIATLADTSSTGGSGATTKKDLKEVVVYPPGVEVDDTKAAELPSQGTSAAGSEDTSTYGSSWLGTKGLNSDDAGKVDTTGMPIIGGGVPSGLIGNYGIIDFASFAQALAFKKTLGQNFSERPMQSLHDYIAEFMDKFYHQMYYIPNLRNNYVMVVKPETMFIHAPSCNLVFPNIKSSIAYSIPFKEQPTRLIQQSDPVAAFTGNNTPLVFLSMMFMEENDLDAKVNGLPVRQTYITSLGKQNLTDKTHPMLNLTEFEKRNGIRVSNVSKGADMWLFLKSKNSASSSSDGSYQISLGGDMAGVANTLGALARYELARQRFLPRQGSIDMYFNPYIVPGFPFVSLEGAEGKMNVYGYVTNVVHNITERSWSTTVAFTCGHGDTEQSPGAYPIVESEYADNIASTYADMLGPTVTPVTNTDIPKLISEYTSESQYMTVSYKKIWRETPTIESYLKDVADGAQIVQMDDYWYFKGDFFDEDLQKCIREYTEDLIVYKYAQSIEDIR